MLFRSKIFLHNDFPFNLSKDISVGLIEYQMEAYKKSGYGGVASGWETIALPFDVEQVYSVEKNNAELLTFRQMAEKGNPANVYPYWLREMTDNGFVSSHSLKANYPYIICFPNNTDFYLDEWIIKGEIRFKAENILLGKTPEPITVSGPEFSLSYTFKTKIGRASCRERVYVLV